MFRQTQKHLEKSNNQFFLLKTTVFYPEVYHYLHSEFLQGEPDYVSLQFFLWKLFYRTNVPDKLEIKSPLKNYSLVEMCQNLFWFGTQKSPSLAWSAAPKEDCSSCLRNFMGFRHLLGKHPGDPPSFSKANIHRLSRT